MPGRQQADPKANAAIVMGGNLNREVFDQLGSMSSSDLKLLEGYLREESEAYRRKSAYWSKTSVLTVFSALAIVGLLAAYGTGTIGLPFDVLASVMFASFLIAFLLWALDVRSSSGRRLAQEVRNLPAMRREEKLRFYARLQVEEQEAEKWSLRKARRK